jgi:subtilase family serine protease
VAALDAGKQVNVAFDDVRLGKGEHKLTATADSKTAVNESKEGNNQMAVTVGCKDESN